MSEIGVICEAIKLRLASLPDVDQAATDSYLPPVNTEKIALVIPPFEQASITWRMTAKLGPVFRSHRIRCEFWVKVDTGNLALTISRAREIGQRATTALLLDRTLEGAIQNIGVYGPGDAGMRIESEIASTPITIAGVPYIVHTLIVPVTDYADAA